MSAKCSLRPYGESGLILLADCKFATHDLRKNYARSTYGLRTMHERSTHDRPAEVQAEWRTMPKHAAKEYARNPTLAEESHQSLHDSYQAALHRDFPNYSFASTIAVELEQ